MPCGVLEQGIVAHSRIFIARGIFQQRIDPTATLFEPVVLLNKVLNPTHISFTCGVG